MLFLTLETTCDETAAAVIRDDLTVLGSALSTQDILHDRFRRRRSRTGLAGSCRADPAGHRRGLRQAGVGLAEIGAVAVANAPGLAGSLLVGLAAAKSLCVALGVPLIAVNHLHAHIYACRLAGGARCFPLRRPIASGGHTSLYTADPLHFELLGGTIDDAAGEAFDKVASMLGLPYPGGPSIDLRPAAAIRGRIVPSLVGERAQSTRIQL